MTAIDDYLDRPRHELQSSPEETEEVLREVRSHLELAALETGRGRGQEASSVAQAIDRFGGVQQIGGDLRQVHGRATLVEAGLAALPMLLFSVLLALPLPAPQSHYWIGALLLAATALAWRALARVVVGLAGVGALCRAHGAGRPGLGRGAVHSAHAAGRPPGLAGGYVGHAPVATVWAFRHLVLLSAEVRNVNWSATAVSGLLLAMAIVWCVLLFRMLRVPPGVGRAVRVLEGQGIIVALNGLVIVAARLWPTYPFPYAFSVSYFLSVTVPYAMFHGLPFLLFLSLTM